MPPPVAIGLTTDPGICDPDLTTKVPTSQAKRSTMGLPLLGCQSKLRFSSCCVICFLRGRQINHDTQPCARPYPIETRSPPKTEGMRRAIMPSGLKSILWPGDGSGQAVWSKLPACCVLGTIDRNGFYRKLAAYSTTMRRPRCWRFPKRKLDW